MLIEELVEKTREALAKELDLPKNTIFFDFGKFADFSTMITIKYAKKLGKPPKDMAESVATKLKVAGLDIRAENGFLNCYLTEAALQENLGKFSNFNQRGKVIVEYSSPNIAKPFSVGHLRSTIIGESLKRIFEELGWKVTGMNFIGDWGTQFGKLITAYKLWGEGLEPTVKNLLSLYVKFHKEVENNPELEAMGREWFKKLEGGDKEALKIWETFRKNSFSEFEKIYKRLGISKLEDGSESLFVKGALELVDELRKKGIAIEDDGALVIPTSKDIPLLLRKSDGTTIYAARDMMSAIWRTKQFKPDLLLYVVGNDQKLHFELLFEGLKKYGLTGEMEHIGFGMIRLPEGKMSTRRGRVIFLEDVLNEAVSRVAKTMKDRDAYSESDAEKIGIGAVKFTDLRTTRTRDVVFTWDMLKTEGETGPYVQYAAVRAKRVLEKFGKVSAPGKKWQTAELKLARKIVAIRLAILEAGRQRRPDLVARWLLDSAKAFNDFYEKNRIEGYPTRQWLTEQFYTAMERGMYLLGLEIPNQM
ncbi:MAG: arginine--tRNA ligase [Candidatus Altiarchaeota archaeon]|nr:arginine--tRNA ligase [Candidatus Altiarchaeota archaeon]